MFLQVQLLTPDDVANGELRIDGFADFVDHVPIARAPSGAHGLVGEWRALGRDQDGDVGYETTGPLVLANQMGTDGEAIRPVSEPGLVLEALDGLLGVLCRGVYADELGPPALQATQATRSSVSMAQLVWLCSPPAVWVTLPGVSDTGVKSVRSV